MKRIGLWLIGFSILTGGCDREPSPAPEIDFVSSTLCKNMDLKSTDDHSSDQDCIQYKWVEGDSLILKHVNAAFNCCPEGFLTELKVSGDTLIITESENSSLCDCNCLYDLNYSLSGINKSTWWIRVEEPYVQQQEAAKLLFKLELRKVDEGEICVTRTGYPWGT